MSQVASGYCIGQSRSSHWTVSRSRECGERSLGSQCLLIPSHMQAHMPTHAYRAPTSHTTSLETCMHSYCSTKRESTESVCTRSNLVALGQLLPRPPPHQEGVFSRWGWREHGGDHETRDVRGPQADSPSVMAGGSPVRVYYRFRDNQHKGHSMMIGHTLGCNLCI